MTTPHEGEPEGGHGPTPDDEHTGAASNRGPAGADAPGAPRASTAGESAPESPTALRKSSWKDALKRTLREFQADNLSDWGAALTYYGVLAIFPALLALVSILGLLGSSTIKPLIDNLGSLAPDPSGTSSRACWSRWRTARARQASPWSWASSSPCGPRRGTSRRS